MCCFIETGSCSTNKCTQLCLPKPNKKKVCACADDQMLDVKTKKCKCIGGLTTLKNGTCKRACKSFSPIYSTDDIFLTHSST